MDLNHDTLLKSAEVLSEELKRFRETLGQTLIVSERAVASARQENETAERAIEREVSELADSMDGALIEFIKKLEA